LGIGRLGSILGPLVGGILINLQVTTQTLFDFFAVPALLAAICVISVKRTPGRLMYERDRAAESNSSRARATT
jgi:hypothetical protein